MTKAIPLTQGQVTIVDDEDFEYLNQWKWHYSRSHFGHDARRKIRKDGRRASLLMHRAILNAPADMHVDHINRDALDNRRANLRLCTPRQNQWNSHKRPACSSTYKGVSWHKQHRKWHAYIILNSRTRHLGYYDDEQEAARAYNAAAQQHFGEFARLNEIANAPPAG